MDNEKDFLLSNLINSLIKDEWTAVNAYESAIATLTDTGNLDVIAILEDIRDEEYVHIGQLESCLSLLKGDPTEHIEDGSEEGFEQLELPEEDEEEVELQTESLTEDYGDIQRIEHDEAYDIIDNHRPRGSFLTREGNKFIAIDNLTGDAWVEEFDTEEEAIKWLRYEEDGGEEFFEVQDADGNQIHLFDTEEEAIDYAEQDEDAQIVIKYTKYYDESGNEVDFEPDGKVWVRESNEKLKHLKEEKKPTLSEKEMKKIICDMITKYDASEEEIFDELQSQDPAVSRDTARRLYKMCNQRNEKLEKVAEKPTFDDLWEELEEIGE